MPTFQAILVPTKGRKTRKLEPGLLRESLPSREAVKTVEGDKVTLVFNVPLLPLFPTNVERLKDLSGPEKLGGSNYYVLGTFSDYQEFLRRATDKGWTIADSRAF